MAKFIEFEGLSGNMICVERNKIQFVEQQVQPDDTKICVIVTGENFGVRVKGALAAVIGMIESFDAAQSAKETVRA